MRQPLCSAGGESSSHKPVDIDFSRLLDGDKRKNPFSKTNIHPSKKAKLHDACLDESSDKTLFALLKLPAKVVEKPPQAVDTEKLSTFSNLLQKFTAEHTVEKYKHLPIDWALKTKLRLMSPKPFAWSLKLKACEEASGITGFPRHYQLSDFWHVTAGPLRPILSLLATPSPTLAGNIRPLPRHYQLADVRHVTAGPLPPILPLLATPSPTLAGNIRPFPRHYQLADFRNVTAGPLPPILPLLATPSPTLAGNIRPLSRHYQLVDVRHVTAGPLPPILPLLATPLPNLARNVPLTHNLPSDSSVASTLPTRRPPRARFHQSCLYWQHPHLPWLEMFPRSSGKVAATSFMATNEEVRQALHREWTESFRSLFQLLRALHCPYFYVCANTFTCLFRAAGLCGVSEPCALIAPTTRGFRQTLRQEDVEFTMPLRPENKTRLNTSEEQPKNASVDSCYDTMDERTQPNKEEDDEEDPNQFLSQLGLETESIVSPTGPFAGVPPTLLAPTAFHGGTLQSLKVKENTIHSESNKYYSIELRGPVLPTAVHTLFDVLRSSSAAHFSATFAHHQPTLAFSNKYYSIELRGPVLPTAVHTLFDVLRSSSAAHFSATFAHHQPTLAFSNKYYSIELRGPVLPTAVHTLFDVLRSSSAAHFSATFAHHQPTLAFSYAAHSIARVLLDRAARSGPADRRPHALRRAEEQLGRALQRHLRAPPAHARLLENEPNHFAKAFNKENLSDSGISDSMLQHFCSADPSAVRQLDSV
ncbi:Protein downstream neighbor of son-like protein, partial [Operophtera brumata]